MHAHRSRRPRAKLSFDREDRALCPVLPLRIFRKKFMSHDPPNSSYLTRREWNRFAAAVVTALLTGCTSQGSKPVPPSAKVETNASGASQANATLNEDNLLKDPHICRGLNTCKNMGKSGTTNDCAGQAHCATVVAHDCNGLNDCKGQGGCGEHPGENSCKGQGACAVPLTDKTWPKARKKFEELMAKAGKKPGDAPPKMGS